MNYDATYWSYTGGLVGTTPFSVVLARHYDALCKPGLWAVALAVQPEVAKLLDVQLHITPAVMDDFGSLVGVPA